MKKKVICLIASILCSSVTIASPEVKFNGVLDFNIGSRIQADNAKKNLSANNDSLVLNSSASLIFNIEDEFNGLKYGATLVTLTTVAAKKSPGLNGSYLYLTSADFGRLEFGSPFDVSTNTPVDLGNVAAATGGTSWSTLLNTNPNGANGFDLNIFDFYLANFTAKNFGAVDREPSRKINYYTPEIQGFKFGVSFIPDTTNGGADSKTESSSYADRQVQYVDTAGVLSSYNIRYGATNAFALGASYKAQINEATSFSVAVTSEFGKAIQEAYITKENFQKDGYVIDPNVSSTASKDTQSAPLTGAYKIKDLASFNIGAQLSYGNFAYAVTYGN